MRSRFEELAHAAASATATDVSIERSSRYEAMRPNVALAAAWNANMVALGQTLMECDPDRTGSTDMGNVSHIVPTIHPTIAMAPDGHADALGSFRRGCSKRAS